MSPDKRTLDELRIDRAAAPVHRLQGWLILAVLGFIAVGVGLVWWFGRPKAAAVHTFLVQESAEGGQKTLLNASGYVTARRQATVSSKFTGKVVEVMVEEGMKVEAGQVLARIDSSNVEKSLHLAEAQLESARKGLDETKANLDQAERELRRAAELAANKVASQSDLDRAEAEAKSLSARLERQRADVAVAEREVAVWKQQLDDTIIHAPFAGIVTSKNAQPGEMISPMSAGGSFTRTGICTIVDMSSLEIEVDVNESYINRVEPGQGVEATLDSYPDWHIPSKVIAIIPTADRQKATVKVRVGFKKLDPRVLPDMGVKVAFQGADEKQPGTRNVVIPKTALQRRDGRDVVWITRGGRAERRAVTVAATHDNEATIAAGLSGGERVVVEGPADLVEGARVTETKK
ncbi:MAG: efflux RND transporter periplasmic adaptor subunit [Verrucomicrobia bacterium]|nr:MAG: efflux RND transporter periplasmic adaptor subunit [Verrucomicrobiota bacterium]